MEIPKLPQTLSKIRFQLALLVLAAVLPVWLLSGVLVFQAYDTKRGQANKSMLDTSHSLAMRLDRELTIVQAALVALATSPAFATGDFDGVQRQALLLLKSYPGADVIVADPTGQQLINSARPYGSPLPTRNNPETVRRIFKTGKPIIGDLYYGALTKRPLISIDIPVVQEGRVAYDLAMTFPAARMDHLLQQQRLPPDCYGVILDSKPMVVARSRYTEKYVGQSANSLLRQAMTQAPEGMVEYTNVEGKPSFVAFCRSAVSPWSVVVGMPKLSLLAGIYRWVGWAAAGATALSLFGITLAFGFGRRIVRAEEARYQSEEQYRVLFDTILEGFCIIKVLFNEGGRPIDYRFLEINPTFEAQTGLRDAQNKLMRDLAPDHEEHWFEIYGKVALTGEPARFVNEAKALERWFDVSAYRIGEPHSRKVAILFNDITEAKRAEEALRESERRYSALFANKINGVAHCRIITDELGVPSDYLILQVNDAYERITGVRKVDIEGRRVTEVFPDIKGYAFNYIGTYGRLAQEGGEIKFEEYFEATRQFLSIYAYSPLPGEFAVLFTDVTERRRAEQWLLESQTRMATFTTATFEGIIESEAGRIVDCNDQIARMLGYPASELKGMQIAALVAPEDLDRVMANIRQGRESVVEHVLLGKDGSRIVAEAHGRSMSPGSPTRLTAIRDITERKRMESALQTTLQRFYDVLSSMYCGILLVTDEERVEFVNQAFCECFSLKDAPCDLVGLAPRELIEKIGSAFVHPEEALARIRETLELGLPVKGEEVSLQGGRTCLRDFVHLKIAGKSFGRLWLHIDITEHKRAKEHLQKAHDDLEQRVAERTAQLAAALQAVQVETAERIQAVEALRGKEQMLIQQSRQAAMGEMIGNIAHQWRQPLNLLGLTSQQLLLFYDLGEFDRQFLAENIEKIMGLIQHMSQTIDDFRNYFKPDKEKSDFRVQETIANTLSLLKGSLQSPRISIEIVVQDDAVIHGYPNEFAQVLLNIVINAKEVLSERGISAPKLVITAFREESSAVVTIADNGGGVPEELLGKIFDPYFTTKGPQQGTGIGLFMSKSIIERNMGGRLTVRNTSDGAEFRIEV